MSGVRNALKWLDELLPGHPISLLHTAVYGELLHLSLDVTGTCNLNCVMCSLHDWHTPGPILSEHVLSRLDSVFPSVKSVDLFSECEPLLHPRLPEIVHHIKGINPNIRTQLVTNGTLLTPHLAQALISAGLDAIGFSIDSCRPEMYESIRRGARYDAVLSNIKDFMRVNFRSSTPCRCVYLIVVVSKANQTDLCGLIQLAATMGITRVLVNGLEPYTSEMAKSVLYGDEVSDEIRTLLRHAKDVAKKLGVELHLPSLHPREDGKCILRRCLVDSEGSVYPCAGYAYAKPYYSMRQASMFPRLTFGNVMDREFMEIWNSHEYRRFRRSVSSSNLPEACQVCLTRKGVIHPR